MKYLSNERGNSAFYIIWLLGISAVIFVIVINIAKVYVVKQQASTATQQAAFAGTIVFLEVTQKGIENFDSDLTKSTAQKKEDGESIQDQIDHKVDELVSQDVDLQQAYIKAYNEVLPEKLRKHPQFEIEMKETFRDSGLRGKLLSAVQSTITANEANADDFEVLLSDTKWRVEVTADATYKTITDGTYLQPFTSDIKQKGVGPSLKYLEYIPFE
ncbi:hypothetical protein MHH33_15485 [Paenisporosarcina sp. FSL H8-0542]|uniref:hypothetical protein n=1 Tax=unclassified Paenisporosarcina TaxID=2642018 RepID=UPI00034E0065|nr:hypothetical protein [Paenisporosarcina sp. HGH0030]EPD51310.1 hypothetical protein HMPREF1210_01908 [Paenisporosarcina sp. HGH0030]